MTVDDQKSTNTERVEALELSSKHDIADPDAEIQAVSADFASRDGEWHAYHTKQLLRKIDIHLLPWIVLMYLTNFLDRT